MAPITWQKYLDDYRERVKSMQERVKREGTDLDSVRAELHHTMTTGEREMNALEEERTRVKDQKNREVFEDLMMKWRREGLKEQDEAEPGRWYTQANFFRDVSDKLKIGEKVAAGGQAEIYSALYGAGQCILKVFNRDYDLTHLQRSWPETLLAAKSRAYKYENSPDNVTDEDLKMYAFQEGCCRVWCGTLLKGQKDFAGRFAFLMDAYWGDLRSLIDLQMSDENLYLPPFEDSLAISLILQIAKGMQSLHALNVLHRDLKASNVLLLSTGLLKYGIDHNSRYHDSMCRIADYESSANIVGTKCWMAPEVLGALPAGGASVPPEYFTPSSDVYSYGLTCYEVLTGILFDDADYHVALMKSDGLPFPEYVPADLRELLKQCWDRNPRKRPTFEDIVVRVEKIQRDDGQKKEELSAERRKRNGLFCDKNRLHEQKFAYRRRSNQAT